MDKTVHIEKIPDDLWRRFKGHCAMNGVTIREQIITLVEQWIEQQEKGKP
jgi:predicted XRE-type DNA-binding protein